MYQLESGRESLHKIIGVTLDFDSVGGGILIIEHLGSLMLGGINQRREK